MPFKRDWYCEKCDIRVMDIPTSVGSYDCPLCGGKTKKVLVPPTIVFRGEGWTEKFYGNSKEG